MGRPYSTDLRERVLRACEVGDESQAAIAQRFEISVPVFLGFLQTTLLPSLREQKPDAILVMDKLSAHKNQAVKDAIAAAGLTVRYLPRYSPDFSPIEPCWSKIKTALRAVAARTVESLRAALDTAAAAVTADDAAGWFGHCGYTSPS